MIGEVKQKVIDNITEKCNKNIANIEYYYKNGPIKTIKMLPDVEKLIETNIKNHTSTIISDAIERWKNEVNIKSYIKKSIDDQIEYYIRSEVRNRLKKIVENIDK